MGSNRDGQLGLGSEPTKRTPTLITDDVVVNNGLARSHSLFLAYPGNVYVTGSNLFGALGDNTSEGTTEPQVLRNMVIATRTRTTTSISMTTTSTSTGSTRFAN